LTGSDIIHDHHSNPQVKIGTLTEPFIWGWQGFGRLYPDGRVPFSRRKDNDLIQELINASKKILSVLGFVCNFMEDLDKRTVITGLLSQHNLIKLIQTQSVFFVFFFSGTATQYQNR